MKSFISLEEALEIIDKNINNTEIEEVNLLDSVNKILGENIVATIDNPPFNKSAMDGYAINFQDSLIENNNLEVIGTVYAGEVFKETLTKGKAVKIMTGAPIPNGANAVIKQEDVKIEECSINFHKQMKENENICFKGEDIFKGKTLAIKGKLIDYADIGIMASSGIDKVKVYKSPKISLISTGDEVVDIATSLSEGKIYNSNKYSILARTKELGYEVSDVCHVADSYEEIGNKIKELSEKVDLIITTGGASVGEKDLLNKAIEYIDGEKLFWKIKIKPGSAILCSKYNGKLIISLSGNPTAALTTFELLVRTSLEKLRGNTEVEIKREKAMLLNSFNKRSPQRRFLRGKVVYIEEKQCIEITQTKSGNGILSSALNSNALIELEAGNEGIKEGQVVNIIKF